MSKDDTNILKGIAILFLLFLHLFGGAGFVGDCTPLVWVGGTPLVVLLAKSCSSVIFLFLACSGYGLAYVHHRGRLTFPSQARRLTRLYLNYWLILLIFAGIGSAVRPDIYPGTPATIVKAMTGWSVFWYDQPAWFLLPYSIVSLLSPLVFRAMDRLGDVRSLAAAFLVTYGALFVISRFIVPHDYSPYWLYIVLLSMMFLLAFVFGAVLNYRVERGQPITVRWLQDRQWLTLALLAAWIAAHTLTDSHAFNTLFAMAFILLFVNIRFRGIARKVLLALGHVSMEMWLLHAFFYKYLFRSFFYGLKYPLVIFAALLLASYVSALAVHFISVHTIGKLPFLRSR